jgi:hypothetical protein
MKNETKVGRRIQAEVFMFESHTFQFEKSLLLNTTGLLIMFRKDNQSLNKTKWLYIAW